MGGWSTPEIAIETINQLCDHCQIYFAEQPVPPAIPRQWQRCDACVCADHCDEVFTRWKTQKVLARAERPTCFRFYVGRLAASVLRARSQNSLNPPGIKCTIGSNLELGVGSAAMIHLL